MKEKNDDEPIAIVQESRKGDLVAEAKRKANGQAFPKQHRDNFMDIEALMNKSPVVRPQMVVPEPTRKKKNKGRSTKHPVPSKTTSGSTI